jgi:DMSO/TMAO reductase YedYZ molybdopterin-dependent catalytic subunit
VANRGDGIVSDALTIVKREPFNAETGPGQLEPELTPTPSFYVRCHFAVPRPEQASAGLQIAGSVQRPTSLGLDELRALGSRTVVSTMECAGNGRTALAPLPGGEPWGSHAVATARWTGVPLRAVLERVGLAPETREILATGADSGQPEDAPAALPYQRALPLDKALHPDTLLAWEMNDASLTLEHGAPLRLIAPGWYGMASVKWLTHLEALTAPFDGYYQVQRYVYDRGDGSPPIPVTTMRIKSLIVSPPDGARLGVQPLTVRGKAWSGAGQIVRVEIAPRGGDAWEDARLLGAPSPYAWAAFEYTWHPPAPGRHVLRVRATDAAGNQQPAVGEWNRHGYGSNAVRTHLVEVEAEAR